MTASFADTPENGNSRADVKLTDRIVATFYIERFALRWPGETDMRERSHGIRRVLFTLIVG